MLTFPASPTTGQQFQTWTWDGTKWTPTSTLSNPNCGYFGPSGASPSASVIFAPFNGDLIRINGLNYKIPAAGITAAYNNCFISGTAGQTLSVGNSYLIYAFMHSTLGMQLDFVAGVNGHATSSTAGNAGVEIKAGDNTRTLVGLAYCSSAPTPFYDTQQNRMVRSWFNRRTVAFFAGGGGNFNAYALQCYCNLVVFGGEHVNAVGAWYGTADTAANAYIVFNNNSAGNIGYAGYASTVNTTASYENCQALFGGVFSEGLNQLGLYGAIGAGTTGGACAMSGMF